jgi:hypothetical protein
MVRQESREARAPVECPCSTEEFKPFRLTDTGFSSLVTECRTKELLVDQTEE